MRLRVAGARLLTCLGSILSLSLGLGCKPTVEEISGDKAGVAQALAKAALVVVPVQGNRTLPCSEKNLDTEAVSISLAAALRASLQKSGVRTFGFDSAVKENERQAWQKKCPGDAEPCLYVGISQDQSPATGVRIEAGRKNHPLAESIHAACGKGIEYLSQGVPVHELIAAGVPPVPIMEPYITKPTADQTEQKKLLLKCYGGAAARELLPALLDDADLAINLTVVNGGAKDTKLACTDAANLLAESKTVSNLGAMFAKGIVDGLPKLLEQLAAAKAKATSANAANPALAPPAANTPGGPAPARLRLVGYVYDRLELPQGVVVGSEQERAIHTRTRIANAKVRLDAANLEVVVADRQSQDPGSFSFEWMPAPLPTSVVLQAQAEGYETAQATCLVPTNPATTLQEVRCDLAMSPSSDGSAGQGSTPTFVSPSTSGGTSQPIGAPLGSDGDAGQVVPKVGKSTGCSVSSVAGAREVGMPWVLLAIVWAVRRRFTGWSRWRRGV